MYNAHIYHNLSILCNKNETDEVLATLRCLAFNIITYRKQIKLAFIFHDGVFIVKFRKLVFWYIKFATQFPWANEKYVIAF